MLSPAFAPSIVRALCGLTPEFTTLIVERYQRILPILLRLFRPREILERNRAWPGVSPVNKGTTRLLATRKGPILRACIEEYVLSHANDENADELWQLLRVYCHYGPIGLAEALPSSLPLLVVDVLQDCADFHRLAKHPRTDAGIYIRELLDHYADDLGIARLPSFVARYAFASDRRVTRWFVGEGPATEAIPKNYRRLNLNQPFPNQRWTFSMSRLPFQCQLARRHRLVVTPWLTWITDDYSRQVMGLRVCVGPPTPQDAMITLRWSIWHYDAPWWPARGAPDVLCLPPSIGNVPACARRALAYTHTRLLISDASTFDEPSLPDLLVDWVRSMNYSARSRRTQAITVAALNTLCRDYVREVTSTMIAAAPTPAKFVDQRVSLPWSVGIAAALLLPSGGRQIVSKGTVSLYDVPFDAAAGGVSDGTMVDLRYDPDDARAIYLISGDAWVARAPASAFEHHIPWIELVNSPVLLRGIQ